MVEAYVLQDSAVSAASIHGRPALRNLVEAAKRRPKPFDRILIDDSSRLSRNIADSLKTTEILKFNGVYVTSVSQGIDSEQQSSRQLFTLQGMMDEQFLVGLADKVHRGQEGKALQGLITGGRCYGYRNVPIEDPNRIGKYGRPEVTGVRAEIDEEQAAVVRRIFEMAADGFSLAQIAKILNGEGVPSPQPPRGRNLRAWAYSSIHEMLYNERYRGFLVWNRTQKKLNPETGRKVSKPRPESEWKRVETPDLRIISEDLWTRVAAGRAERRKAFGNASTGLSKSVTSKYLFSGLLFCGICQTRLVVVSGGVSGGYAKYGCPGHRYKGTCSNNSTIRVDRLEKKLIDHLRKTVLTDEMADYAVQEFEKQLKLEIENLAKQSKNHQTRIKSLISERDGLRSEVQRIISAIRAAGHSEAMLRTLRDVEARIAELENAIGEKQAPRAAVSAGRLREHVLHTIHELRELLKTNTQRTKGKLNQHVQRLVLTPTDTSEGRAYAVKGDWRLLPENDCVITLVARDGIEPPTPASSGLRSTS